MSYQDALTAIQSGQFEAAIALLEPLLQAEPDQAKLWQAKAIALLSLDHADASRSAVEQAIRLDPELAAAHQLLGKVLHALGEKAGAIAAYKQAARCYLAQQDKANAQACVDKIEQLKAPAQPALLISPDQFLTDARAKRQQGKSLAALQDLNWLLQFEPNHVEALVERSLLQADCRNPAAAVSDMARALKLRPEDPKLLLHQAQMRLQIGDAHGAINALSTLLPLKTVDSIQVYRLRGKAYQSIQNHENAFKDFSNALGIDPKNADCYRLRGETYEAMGDRDEALSNYRQAASLYIDQGDWTAHKTLQDTIQKLDGNLQKRKAQAERIIRVPIKFLTGGAPVVEVMFNNRCCFDMVLDTGAGITCLTQRMADVLNLIPTGTRRFRVANGQIVEPPVGAVRSVAIDRAEVSNLEVAIFSTYDDYGLLGQNYLWRYDVRISRTEVELYLR